MREHGEILCNLSSVASNEGNEELKAENERLRSENQRLQEEVERLRRELSRARSSGDSAGVCRPSALLWVALVPVVFSRLRKY